jgi:hypothetical protein
VQANLVVLLELRLPVLGQEIVLPLYATTIATRRSPIILAASYP